MCITRVKWKIGINNFKNVNLPFLQGIRFNIFQFAPTITLFRTNGRSDISHWTSVRKANSFDTETPFLNFDLYITKGIVSSKIYDKWGDFDFLYRKLSLLSWNSDNMEHQYYMFVCHLNTAATQNRQNNRLLQLKSIAECYPFDLH